MQPALNYGFAEPDPNAPWQLPTDHPDVLAMREEMKNIMRFWLNMGVDGFRVDMACSLVKNDPDKKKTAEFWTDVRAMLDSEFPEAALIAEWSNPAISIPAGFHTDFLLHTTPAYYSLFRREIDHLPVPPTSSEHSYFRREGKGDIAQFLEVYTDCLEKTKDLGYISIISGNHDLPRLAMGRDTDELKVAFAFVLTMPGVPFVYNGDETGMDYMHGLVSKEGGYGRTGSRTPMQWTKGPNAGFSTADSEQLYLPVDEDGPTVVSQMGVAGSLLETVRELNSIRMANPALEADGEFEVLYAEKDKYPFVYLRRTDAQSVVVALNPSGRDLEISVNIPEGFKQVFPLMVQGAELDIDSASAKLKMTGVSFGIFELK